MKKAIFALLVTSLCFAACQTEAVNLNGSNLSDSILSAKIEQNEMTKTVLGEGNNILWSENDQIIAFMKSSFGHKYQIKPSFAGKTYAHFSKKSFESGDDLFAGMEWDHNVAYYPYSESIECVKAGDNYTLEVTLPAEQTFARNSFGNGTFPMVAVSEDNDITFKNICGGIKLQLKGSQTVKSITLQGRNNEKISGTATVTAYTDETKPVLTMNHDVSTTVTLNCGDGITLEENTATEFIIVVPPVLFIQGFMITVTDADDKEYIVETDKTNTVLRSSLLVMPPFKLGDKPNNEDTDDEDELIVPVSSISLNSTSLTLYQGDIAQLTATIAPKDATDKTVTWSSDNPLVASVDQTGLVTANAGGTANITAVAGGKSATCIVTVSALSLTYIDYVDEYDINHGPGIKIGETIWAPVNCGYHAEDFKYGKLYQWGRKYGQGYNGLIFANGISAGEYLDAIIPSLSEGGVSAIGGNHKSNANIFYYGASEWVDPQDDTMWNSGTESEPIKTDYDPCPDGWRVPTYSEISELGKNSSAGQDEYGLLGYWFSGASSYTESVPQMFLPTAGYRNYSDGVASIRGARGYYWSSKPNSHNRAYNLRFGGNFVYDSRAYGLSVRCVQE